MTKVASVPTERVQQPTNEAENTPAELAREDSNAGICALPARFALDVRPSEFKDYDRVRPSLKIVWTWLLDLDHSLLARKRCGDGFQALGGRARERGNSWPRAMHVLAGALRRG
jgi:hypothetical protein